MERITYATHIQAFIKIPPHEILYLYQERPETLLVVGQYRTCFITSTLDRLKNDLISHGFIRSHSDFLINLNHIQFFNKSMVRIGHVELPISQSGFNLLLDRLNVVRG